VTPIPHFSYHVAERYDLERVAGVVRQIARDTPPFRVKTSGLGIFTGPERVLYVIVDHNPILAALHRRIWEAMDGLTDTANPYYHPDTGIRIITHKDVTTNCCRRSRID
jgi:2'-5' RNA ligase